MECIFCRITKGEVPVHKVWEDDLVFAFLDMHPIRPGHTLVIPKKHEPEFQHLDDETYDKLMMVVKKISKKVEQNLKPKRVGLMIAGWDVPHAHVHVVPMETNHDILSRRSLEDMGVYATDAELKEVRDKLIS